MGQTIAATIIIALAAVAAVVKLYKFFKNAKSGDGCNPDACASCPLSTSQQGCSGQEALRKNDNENH